jgi:succinate--hydroxymethylglutarate CoA-transferase
MIAGAEAGLLHLSGERGGKPVRPGLGLTDMCTGLYMHGAIVSALYARDRTGEGQQIDGSLFETQVALLTNVALSWLNLGIEAERWGTQHPSVVPYDAFKTKDLFFVCGALNDKQFATLVQILGRADLSDDSDFASNPARVRNRDKLYTILGDLFLQKNTIEWEQAFEGSGLPYAPINTMEKVFNHPQTRARDMVTELEFAAAKKGSIQVLGMGATVLCELQQGTDIYIGPAIKFSKTPTSIRSRPPLHGEQTEEVLAELGISADEVAGLKAEGVV